MLFIVLRCKHPQPTDFHLCLSFTHNNVHDESTIKIYHPLDAGKSDGDAGEELQAADAEPMRVWSSHLVSRPVSPASHLSRTE